MVMPRSRSRGFESMTQSVVSWFDRNAPDCRSRKSTSVVLPWSTWAMIAMFLRSIGDAEYSLVPEGMQPRFRRGAIWNPLLVLLLLHELEEAGLDLELRLA